MSRCGIGIGRVNMDQIRFTRRLKCRICGRLLGSEQITRICILLIFLKFNCCHLCIGNFGTLLEALLRLLSIDSNCDHTPGARHLQLEVYITQSIHETCVCRPPQNGMISTLEIHDFKCQLFFAKMLRITKHYVQSYLAE